MNYAKRLATVCCMAVTAVTAMPQIDISTVPPTPKHHKEVHRKQSKGSHTVLAATRLVAHAYYLFKQPNINITTASAAIWGMADLSDIIDAVVGPEETETNEALDIAPEEEAWINKHAPALKNALLPITTTVLPALSALYTYKEDHETAFKLISLASLARTASKYLECTTSTGKKLYGVIFAMHVLATVYALQNAAALTNQQQTAAPTTPAAAPAMPASLPVAPPAVSRPQPAISTAVPTVAATSAEPASTTTATPPATTESTAASDATTLTSPVVLPTVVSHDVVANPVAIPDVTPVVTSSIANNNPREATTPASAITSESVAAPQIPQLNDQQTQTIVSAEPVLVAAPTTISDHTSEVTAPATTSSSSLPAEIPQVSAASSASVPAPAVSEPVAAPQPSQASISNDAAVFSCVATDNDTHHPAIEMTTLTTVPAANPTMHRRSSSLAPAEDLHRTSRFSPRATRNRTPNYRVG